MGRRPLKKENSFIDSTVIADIPVELSNNLPLIAKKLTAFLSYYSALNLSRLSTLTNFIQSAEEKMYGSGVDVSKLDQKELANRYREAKKAQAEILNIARQVSEQAVLTDNNTKADEVYSLLNGMNAETLEELQKALMPDIEDIKDLE